MPNPMVACLNCDAIGRFKDGKVCPACDGAGQIEDDYAPTQLDRIEASLSACLKAQSDLADAVRHCSESTLKMIQELTRDGG